MVSATDWFVYAPCLFIIVWVILSLQFSIKKLEQKVKRMELSLSLLLNRMEIEVPSLVSDQVKQLALDPHRKIEAIKLYRGETGASLLEAKEAIEEFILQNHEKWR
jgi:ribosomal protein L7/L12